jgi:ATP-binding protein involved in chromosome partitioning
MADAPTNIRAHQGEQVLELTWEDGRTDRLSYHGLRAQCPCASCQDEWTGARILDPATIRPDLKLEAMEPVGSYAVRLAWNDGHGSGLYTWENLRRLAAGEPA